MVCVYVLLLLLLLCERVAAQSPCGEKGCLVSLPGTPPQHWCCPCRNRTDGDGDVDVDVDVGDCRRHYREPQLALWVVVLGILLCSLVFGALVACLLFVVERHARDYRAATQNMLFLPPRRIVEIL